MSESNLCTVCGAPADDANSAVCIQCDERFHLRMRADGDGPECGQVGINEQYLTMEFACNRCLGVATPHGEGVEPPIGEGH